VVPRRVPVSDFVSVKVHGKVVKTGSDWWTGHRPGGPEDDAGGPMHDLETVFPDVYERPRIYDNGEPGYDEAVRTIMRAKGHPEAQVTIYRSMPAQYAKVPLGKGDWVGISLAYCKQQRHPGSGNRRLAGDALHRAGRPDTEPRRLPPGVRLLGTAATWNPWPLPVGRTSTQPPSVTLEWRRWP
jgi:hypothetical protein